MSDQRPPRTRSAIHAIAVVVVLEALRGRMVWLMLALVLAGFALAQFTAAVTITESVPIAMGTFALWLRTASVCVVALFVSTSMMRDWSDKGMELVLALALPRAVYLYGRLAGYGLVALACALMCSAALLLFVPWQQAAIWGATLALELLLVAALAVLCLLTMTHVTIGISAVAAFYVLARSMDAIRLVGANPIAGSHSDAHALMVFVLDTVAYLLPNLARFARSEWIIFANASLSDLGFAAGQCAIYLTLLVAAAMFDLQRKVL